MKISRLPIAVAAAAWLPYLYLLSRGVHPGLMPLLTAHPLFIFLGVRLKRATGAERRARAPAPIAGFALIALGVLAWGPYLYSKYVLHTALGIAPYFILHVSGVLTGGFLRLSGAPTWSEAFRRPGPTSEEGVYDD